ncbi:hypothetical protein [Acinetobacter sp. CAAS 2-6]|uniref:hypothetical protein n=1 Tax=Acinetobacter sp. CAAS 2-6 TaxID=3016358 RepID=UPI002DD67BC0|nr:hypothetical protein [Acinetobacter sp. CAAS 2-6]
MKESKYLNIMLRKYFSILKIELILKIKQKDFSKQEIKENILKEIDNYIRDNDVDLFYKAFREYLNYWNVRHLYSISAADDYRKYKGEIFAAALKTKFLKYKLLALLFCASNIFNDNFVNFNTRGKDFKLEKRRLRFEYFLIDFYLKFDKFDIDEGYFDKDFELVEKARLHIPIISICIILKILIKDNLKIRFNNKYERKVAHYTNLYVFDQLINKKSTFRLNAPDYMNDPTEGKMLFNFLLIENNNIQVDFERIPYISCFTFNHNSLNQFRLYGRTNDVECSGVSLTVDKGFFLNSRKKTKNLFSLYRCIYLDEKTGYLELAGRNRLSFIQEYHEYGFDYINQRWFLYNKSLDFKNNYVMYLLRTMRELCYEFDSYSNLIHEVLAEINYLFKSFSFREEQECRMVKYEKKEHMKIWNFKFRYINYGGNIFKSLCNVYIGVASKNAFNYISYSIYKNNMFKKMPKIKVSEHPYNPIQYIEPEKIFSNE